MRTSAPYDVCRFELTTVAIARARHFDPRSPSKPLWDNLQGFTPAAYEASVVSDAPLHLRHGDHILFREGVVQTSNALQHLLASAKRKRETTQGMSLCPNLSVPIWIPQHREDHSNALEGTKSASLRTLAILSQPWSCGTLCSPRRFRQPPAHQKWRKRGALDVVCVAHNHESNS